LRNKEYEASIQIREKDTYSSQKSSDYLFDTDYAKGQIKKLLEMSKAHGKELEMIQFFSLSPLKRADTSVDKIFRSFL